MSKFSNKRTFNTLHKNTTSLWNKRYKIAFGLAITLISLMALGTFIRSRMKEVGDKAKETIGGSLRGKPEELIDSAVDKLLTLVGKKATKQSDGSYIFSDTVPDRRIDEISHGLSKAFSDGTSSTVSNLTDRLAKYVNGEIVASQVKGPPTKFRGLIEGLMVIPTNKLKDLWKQLDKSITGNGDEKDIKTSLTNIFDSVKNSAKPSVAELSHITGFSAGLGLKEVLPSILGGTGASKSEIEIKEGLKTYNVKQSDLDTLTLIGFDPTTNRVIELFMKSVIACETIWTNNQEIYNLRRSAFKLMLDNKLKLSLDDHNFVTISKGSRSFKTSIGPRINPDQKNELNTVIQAFGFGKRLKKRSKKRSLKKNKKY